MKNRISLFFLLCIAILINACATDSNENLKIKALRSNLWVIAKGDTTVFKCDSELSKSEDIQYQWFIDNQLLPFNQDSFSFVADTTSGIRVIRCRISDSDDHFDEKSLMIKVVDSYPNVYQEAVNESENPQVSDIYQPLSAINTSNPNIIWEGVPGQSRFLVSIFTKYASSYIPSIGDTMSTYWGINWVTVSNELKNTINQSIVTEQKLDLRIKQMLGLPPNNEGKYIVELWVYPADLFRPAMDPEIDDDICQLTFPANVSQDHQNWFYQNVQSSYGENGYPWTQLGYTYDWGNAISKVGLSEYCLIKNANVKVHSVTLIKDYFEPVPIR